MKSKYYTHYIEILRKIAFKIKISLEKVILVYSKVRNLKEKLYEDVRE